MKLGKENLVISCASEADTWYKLTKNRTDLQGSMQTQKGRQKKRTRNFRTIIEHSAFEQGLRIEFVLNACLDASRTASTRTLLMKQVIVCAGGSVQPVVTQVCACIPRVWNTRASLLDSSSVVAMSPVGSSRRFSGPRPTAAAL